MTTLKQLMSRPNPPIQSLIDSGCMMRIVQFLSSNDQTIQTIAVEILFDISSGSNISHIKILVDEYGIIPHLMTLISNPKKSSIHIQSILILGNIAIKSYEFKNIMITCGTIGLLIEILTLTCQKDKHIIVRALANICDEDNGIYPDYDAVKQILPIFTSIIQTPPDSSSSLSNDHNEQEMLDVACLGLFYLSKNPHPESIKSILEIEGIISKIFELLLSHQNFNIQTSLLKIISNISNDHSQIIFENLNILSQGKKVEKLILIFNEFFQKSDEIFTCSLNSGVIPIFLEILNHHLHGGRNKKKQGLALQAISNAFIHGNLNQKLFLVNQNCIPILCRYLNSKVSDAKTLIMIMDALHSVLQSIKENEEKKGMAIKNNFQGKQGQTEQNVKDLKTFLKVIDEANGFTSLESLQESRSKDVYHKTVNFLQNWYVDQDIHSSKKQKTNEDEDK